MFEPQLRCNRVWLDFAGIGKFLTPAPTRAFQNGWIVKNGFTRRGGHGFDSLKRLPSLNGPKCYSIQNPNSEADF